MAIRIKKLDKDAVIPSYAREGDGAVDLTAISKVQENNIITYGTGLSVEIPKGYVGLIFPRSSIYKTGLAMANSVGVIDSGYRGELMIKFYVNDSSFNTSYKIGDRVAQFMLLQIPYIRFDLCEELTDSERSVHGFGSTGGIAERGYL